jgi:hypothetical protein
MSTEPGQEPSFDELLKTLERGDTPAREKAAQELGNLGDQRAVKPLIELVQRVNLDKKLRLAALEALGKLGDSQAIAPLMGVLKDDDLEVSETAARTLEKLGVSAQSQADWRAAHPELQVSSSPTRKWSRRNILIGVVVLVVLVTPLLFLFLRGTATSAPSATGAGWKITITGATASTQHFSATFPDLPRDIPVVVVDVTFENLTTSQPTNVSAQDVQVLNTAGLNQTLLGVGWDKSASSVMVGVTLPVDPLSITGISCSDSLTACFGAVIVKGNGQSLHLTFTFETDSDSSGKTFRFQFTPQTPTPGVVAVSFTVE